MKNLWIVVAVSAAVFAGCKGGGKTENKTVDLKFNLPAGTQYEYSMSMDMKMKQKIMGQDMDIKNTMGFAYLFESTGDSSGWKKINATITKLSMDMNAMGMQMHFDSDTPPADTSSPFSIMGKVLGAMKGVKFSFAVNDSGQVANVHGLREMMESMMANIPGGGKGMNMDDQSMEQSFNQAFAAYPGKPVKAGDSWSKTMNMKQQGMDIKSENTYTLESVNGDDAVVKVVSKLSSAGTVTGSGADINMSGTSDGKMHMNIPTGMASDGDINTKMQMKVKAQGQEIPMDMDMKTTIKGKKK